MRYLLAMRPRLRMIKPVESAMNNDRSGASNSTTDDAPDAQLVRTWVRQAQGGDQEAFGELVKAHHVRVLNLAARFVNHGDEAQDLAQQAWIKAWSRLHTFEGKSEFFTWMYRLVTFVCLDHLRRTKRKAEVAIPENVEPIPDIGAEPAPSHQTRPDREALHAETREAFNAALARLSPDHRAALVLREVEGLSYEEIARVMKCRLGTVMSRLFYARKQVQIYMKDFQ